MEINRPYHARINGVCDGVPKLCHEREAKGILSATSPHPQKRPRPAEMGLHLALSDETRMPKLWHEAPRHLIFAMLATDVHSSSCRCYRRVTRPLDLTPEADRLFRLFARRVGKSPEAHPGIYSGGVCFAVRTQNEPVSRPAAHTICITKGTTVSCLYCVRGNDSGEPSTSRRHRELRFYFTVS